MAAISAAEYLKQTRDSVEYVFAAITSEEDKICKMAQGLPGGLRGANLRAVRDYFYKNYTSMEWGDDFDDLHIMHAFHQFAASARLIVLHEITAGVLYGTLLQIAKQAISITHGAEGRNCGLGRKVAGLPLAQIIWDARNQALHFEEGARPQTQETFDKLATVYGDGFSLVANPGKNMARGVVRDLLGWSSYSKFEADMQVVAGL